MVGGETREEVEGRAVGRRGRRRCGRQKGVGGAGLGWAVGCRKGEGNGGGWWEGKVTGATWRRR
eukprot:scaffold5987_cov203-Amphora_coffeaeformis.AAC.12